MRLFFYDAHSIMKGGKMGFFDFLKNVGNDIFGGDDEAEKITELINTELGESVKELKVEFDDGTVTLSGSCDTQETKEKAILLAGNLKGVEKVNDENLSAPPAVEPFDFYTIKSGDSLSKISKFYYGDAMKYPLLFEANREIIKNPDLIYPGQVLRVPKITQ
jgi:nucleoid-associated protein YgaU